MNKFTMSSVSDHINSSRQRVLHGLHMLPPAVRGALDASFARRSSSQTGFSLGECAPFLLQPLISGCTSAEVISALDPWLGIYGFTIAIDDAVDSRDSNVIPLMIAASLLLEKALSKAYATSSNQTLLSEAIDRCFDDAAAAFALEEEQRSLLKDYSTNHLNHLARKVALLKVSLHLMDRRGSYGKESAVSRAVDRLAAAMQLLDDTSDWSEDCVNGSTTALLSYAYRWIEGQGIPRENLNPDEVFFAAVVSGGLRQGLLVAFDLLTAVEATIPTGARETFGSAILADTKASTRVLLGQATSVQTILQSRVAGQSKATIKQLLTSDSIELSSLKSEIAKCVNST
jgi:hypothetical protein